MNSTHTHSDYFRYAVFLVFVFTAAISNAGGAESDDPTGINTFNRLQDDSSGIKHWVHKMGDDPGWSARDLNISDWQPVDSRRGSTREPGIQWYRAIVQLEGEQSELDVLAVSLRMIVSAHEIYWDGELVSRGGLVADSLENEVPGPFRKIVTIRPELASPGSHAIAIRLSNFHTNFTRPLGSVSIGYNYDILYDHSYKSSHRIFVGGAFLITGLFCIAMFFAGSRHRSYLLFALYCFIGLSFDMYAAFQLYNEINSEYLKWILWFFQYGLALSFLSFVAFVIYTYDVPRKSITVPFSVVVFAVSIWRPVAVPSLYIWYMELLPVLAGCFLAYSIYRKTTGSVAAFIGLVVWRVFKYPYQVLPMVENHTIFYVVSDIIFLFCIVLSISRIIHAQNLQLQKIQLRSSRLEVDLLKKNIQPHFILNTLQSIMSWIRKNPDNAFQLIEALAEEFRMINRIADKKLIPLHQEIDLCNTHLKLMGFRLGSTFELRTECLPENEQVPPMVFHTLIENSLTHSFKTREEGTIHLRCEKEGRHTVYHLTNAGSRLKEISQKSKDEIQEGMGLKYIKARLQESYPDRWSLDYTLDDEQWRVTIAIEH